MEFKTLKKDKLYHLEFSSWSDFIAQSAQGLSGLPEDERGSRRTDDSQWFGTGCFEDALEIARTGYHEIADKIEAASTLIVDRMTNIIEKEDVTYDVEGHGIDVARFIDDIPECWQKIETVTSGGIGNRIVTILCDIGAHCNIKGDAIINRGIIMCVLVELLQSAGYSCQVIAYLSNEKNDRTICTSIPIKEPDDTLDIGRLAFALAHPSMLRRTIFSVWETLPSAIREHFRFRIGGGYSRPVSGTVPAGSQIESEIKPITLPMMGNAGAIYSQDPKSERVQTWIKEILSDKVKFTDEKVVA